MATFDTDSNAHILVNNCVFQSVSGVITKLSDCGRSDCPNSESYVPPKK